MRRITGLLNFLCLVACVLSQKLTRHAPPNLRSTRHINPTTSSLRKRNEASALHTTAQGQRYCCDYPSGLVETRPRLSTVATLSSETKVPLSPILNPSPTSNHSSISKTPVLRIRLSTISEKTGTVRLSTPSKVPLSSQDIKRTQNASAVSSSFGRLSNISGPCFHGQNRTSIQITLNVAKVSTSSNQYQAMHSSRSHGEILHSNHAVHVTSTIPASSLDSRFTHAHSQAVSLSPSSRERKLSGRIFTSRSYAIKASHGFGSEENSIVVSRQSSLSLHVPGNSVRNFARLGKAVSTSHSHQVFSSTRTRKDRVLSSYKASQPSPSRVAVTAVTKTASDHSIHTMVPETIANSNRLDHFETEPVPGNASTPTLLPGHKTPSSSRYTREMLLLIGAGAFPGLVVVCLLTLYVSSKMKTRRRAAAQLQANSREVIPRRPSSAARTLTPSSSFCSLTGTHLQMDILKHRCPSLPQIIITPSSGANEIRRQQTTRNSYGGRRSKRIVEGTDITIRRASSLQLNVRPARYQQQRKITESLVHQ